MYLSYWDKCELEKTCDVLVIGAGIVGLSAAIEIKTREPNLSVEVLEKEAYGALASSRNAGFACFGSVSEIYADIDRYGEEQTISLVQRRRAGLEKLVGRYGTEALGYQRYGGYEVFAKAEDFERQASRISSVNDWLEGLIFQVVDTPTCIRLHPQSVRNAQEGQLRTNRLYDLLESEARAYGIKIRRSATVHRIDQDSGSVPSNWCLKKI